MEWKFEFESRQTGQELSSHSAVSLTVADLPVNGIDATLGPTTGLAPLRQRVCSWFSRLYAEQATTSRYLRTAGLPQDSTQPVAVSPGYSWMKRVSQEESSC